MTSSSTPVVSWSPGTSPDSARFAKENDELAPYGVKEALIPHSGLDFFKSFSFTSDKLSSGLPTDREWSVGQASIMIIKGTIDLQVAKDALEGEGVHPVQCIIGGTPKALLSIWVNELRDSVCGSYHEYVISMDVHKSDPNKIAFDDSATLASPTYACWYNNFGSDVCEAQYLHTLYISSPLSIMWGREMQAFPKHPEQVISEIDLAVSSAVKSCDFKWKDDNTPLIKIQTKEKFGFLGFCKEGLGLVRHVGAMAVTKFLASTTFASNIVMPSKTASKYNRPRDYTAKIWKGLVPSAVQVWPWDSTTDKIEWNSGAIRDTGCEDNNGVELFEKGKFQPLSVCYVSKVSAVNSERQMD